MPPENSHEGVDRGVEAEGGPERPVNPLEKVARTRGQAGERLLQLKLEPESSCDSDDENGEDANEPGVKDDCTDPVYCDIEQNVREIGAILKTNTEIFDWCMSNMTTGWTLGEDSTSFTRYSLASVQTYLIGSSTQFITFPDRTEWSFNTKPLSKLPPDIDDLIVSKGKGGRFSTFIDYESFFETSLILHEEVLGPFLAKLKDHLITVQICLRKIDMWVMEAQSNIDFLEEMFDIQMERPSSDSSDLEKVCSCPYGTHSDILQCLSCNKPFRKHPSSKRCRPNFSPTFRCKVFQLLKLCDNPSVKIEATFDIATDKERMKLSKLLEFMAVG
ncbi:hypothetical protein ACHAWF_007376 [Thalassiosira exigua]